MARQARFGNFLRWFVLKRDDLGRITLFCMGLARSVTSLAASYFVFPAVDGCEASVRSVGESLELILVTVFARVAADVFIVRCGRQRSARPGDTADHSYCGPAKNEQLDLFEQSQHHASKISRSGAILCRRWAELYW